MIAGAEATLSAAGYTLGLGSSGDDRAQEASQLERFLQHGVSGLIVYPINGPATTSNAPLLRRLITRGFPVVLIDRWLADVDADVVLPDHFGGGFLATRHL